jgi:hypothetical protein
MALIGLTKTTLTRGIPIWQSVRMLETAQGGFTLDTTGLTLGDVIPAGTCMNYNEATRLAVIDTSTPKGLLYEDVTVQVGATLSIVTKGTVYKRRIPVVSGIAALLPRILFSESF